MSTHHALSRSIFFPALSFEVQSGSRCVDRNMGNTTSCRRRRCGLCYFKLPKDTPFLEAPRAQRRSLAVYPPQDWKDGALDEILLPGKSNDIKIPLSGLKASADRGCSGCAALWQVRTEQVERANQTTDSSCLAHDCELHWSVPPNINSVQITSLVRSDRDYHETTHFIRIEFQGRDYCKSPRPMPLTSHVSVLG